LKACSTLDRSWLRTIYPYSFSGQAGIMAYLPSQKIAIAVAVTFDEEAFDPSGAYVNSADDIFREIGAYLAPDEAPPVRPHPNVR
jgi:hypothetical protein